MNINTMGRKNDRKKSMDSTSNPCFDGKWPFIQSWRADMIRICLKGVLKYRIFVLFPLIMTVFLLNILAQGENTKESAAAVIKKVFMESGSEAAKMKFKEMHIDEEGKYYFNEQEFINLGNSLRSSGRVKAAITAFKMTIELFPESSNAWFRLGRAFVRDVNREKAVECYKKALELDSKNAMAKEEMGWIDFRIDDARLETREIERFEPGVKTGLRGPYLGETPPGMKPKVFAPGIVSVYGSNENTITFSPDGKEIYFGKEAGINMCKLTDEGWTAPIKTAIPGYEMQISPSTGKMYFTGGGIWEMERTASGWSKPRKLVDMGMFATVTQDEILYTTVFSQGGKIGRYVKADGKYSNYEILGDQINIATFNAHPYISPDKSFLVFDSNKPGRGGNVNLYISFRKTDGSWSNAIYLGDEINAPGTNSCPSFSPDGKYFFYTSHNDIYWISAEYLKKFKPKKTVTNPLRYHRSNIFPLISSGPCQNRVLPQGSVVT